MIDPEQLAIWLQEERAEWVVQEWVEEDEDPIGTGYWTERMGLYSSEEAAAAACESYHQEEPDTKFRYSPFAGVRAQDFVDIKKRGRFSPDESNESLLVNEEERRHSYSEWRQNREPVDPEDYIV